jgi:hypothetical protein
MFALKHISPDGLLYLYHQSSSSSNVKQRDKSYCVLPPKEPWVKVRSIKASAIKENSYSFDSTSFLFLCCCTSTYIFVTGRFEDL